MKIVNRATFLALPDGTLFSKFDPIVFEPFCIKGETLGGDVDFLYQPLNDSIACADSGEMMDRLCAAEKNPAISLSMDFEMGQRDGCFDEDQLFAVWERADVEALIARLQRTLVP